MRCLLLAAVVALAFSSAALADFGDGLRDSANSFPGNTEHLNSLVWPNGQMSAQPAELDYPSMESEMVASDQVPMLPGEAANPLPSSAFFRSLYFRVDYFHWNERQAGSDFVNEYGVLPTIGFLRRNERRRLRLELFGSQVRYSGVVELNDGTSEPLISHTNYLGGRVEFDYFLFPQALRRFEILAGIGMRIWNREMPDCYNAMGTFSKGYNELWVTVYPYIGIETRRDPSKSIEFFTRSRIGVTAFNYELVSLAPQKNLYPTASITGLVELGVRGDRMFVSGYLEAFAWKNSPVVNNFRQPDSTQFTAGLQSGVYF